VLAGVLLHVVEPPFPIDGTVDFPDPYGNCDLVRDSFPLIHYFDDGHARNQASIERLTAGRGIESGAIQVRIRAIRGYLDNMGSEVAQVGILVVKAFRHNGYRYCARNKIPRPAVSPSGQSRRRFRPRWHRAASAAPPSHRGSGNSTQSW